MASTLKRLGVLLTGGGTTCVAVHKAIVSGEIPDAEISVVIASRPDAKGIGRAQDAGIARSRIHVVKPGPEYGPRLVGVLRQYEPHAVLQLGHIPITPREVTDEYPTYNQHGGGLDPTRVMNPRTQRRDFGGAGMRGMATHAAMYYFGQEFMRRTNESSWHAEVSVHLVTDGLDEGSLVGTGTVELLPADTLDSFHTHVMEAEYALVIDVIKRFCKEGSLAPMERHGPLIPDWALPILSDARRRATEEYPEG